ncbi:MAG: hypothetical protein ACLGIC_08240 [Acidimicrobiia bacterium]
MRIMLTDRSETSARVAEGLRHDGHEVLEQCLPDGGSALTCRGLVEHTCPLDAGADLAITALDHAHEAPAAGTVCARRAAVPVVALGRHDLAHPDLGAVLGRVAELGDDHVTATVQAALRQVLDQLGIVTGEVVVHHDAGHERIVATVAADLDRPTRSMIAVRLLDAATSSRRGGQRRDVAVIAAP